MFALLKKNLHRFTYFPGFVCTTNHPSRSTRPLTSLKKTQGKRFHMNFHTTSNLIKGLMTIIQKKNGNYMNNDDVKPQRAEMTQ